MAREWAGRIFRAAPRNLQWRARLAAFALPLTAAGMCGRTQTLASRQVTLTDSDHGAVAAAIDAMDARFGDPQPDTELHLELTPAGPASPDDSTRGDALLVAMREALRKYSDVRLAANDGFEELPDQTGKRTMHHLTNWYWARQEAQRFDPTRPTGLVYRESSDGTLALLGALYTAPANASPAELDARVPTHLARWHRHVNWCTPREPQSARWLAASNGHPIFGPDSPIASAAACDSVGGVFHPTVFGWMLHVALNGSDDPAIVWNGNVPATGDSTPSTDHIAGPPPPSGTQPTLVAAPVHAAAPPAEPDARTNAPPSAAVDTPTRGPLAFLGRRARRFLTTATVPPAAPPAATSAVPTPPPEGGRTSSTLRSGNRDIAVDRFRPRGRGPFPALVMLHGDGGLPPQSEWFERFATAMTDHGYIVEIVHYFDRTGTVIASPTDRLAHFREWNLTVRDAINDLARSSDVDPARLGIVGTGLGATLGLTIGVQSADIKAVVEYGGSLPVWAVPTVRRMPSVFIAMTEGEAAGASREAHRISALCDATGASCELQEFPQQGRGARAGPNARPNFRDRAIQFLDQHLKN